MAGLWDLIKDKVSALTSIANDEIQEATDPVRGAPIRTRRTEGLKFAPVNRSAYLELENGGSIEFVGEAEDLVSQLDLENPNLDLVTEDAPAYTFTADLPAEPARKLGCTDGRGKIAREIKKREEGDRSKGGRPRKFASNAERQAAYRLREAIKALPPLPHTRKNK
jgi:hypothetical protein